MPIDPSAYNDLTGQIIVEDVIVVEVKSATATTPVLKTQLLTYLHLTKCPVGLLINFNVPRLTEGVARLLNPRAGAEI
jgi:GxxExxY protein